MNEHELTSPVVVISQPMYFPWVGIFEQIRLADVFVHYEDVDYSKGSFFNRVQIKTAQEPGYKWMTVPLQQMNIGTNINQTMIQYSSDWQKSQFDFLKQTYAKSPFKNEMLELVNSVFSRSHDDLASLSIESIESVCRYFGFDQGRQFVRSSKLGIPGKSTQRVLDIVEHFQGRTYVTGHGAINYFDHELLESRQIDIEYMEYKKLIYPQLYGNFTPYVSILDLIANCGKQGIQYICSGTTNWRKFQLESKRSA